MIRKLWCLGLMLAAVAVAAGCGDGSEEDPVAPPAEPSKFVGLWKMTSKSDPSDPGFDWRFNADGTNVLYNPGSTAPKGLGTHTISGQNALGTWQNDPVNKGRFSSTLTGDNSLDFNFIEDKYTPPKTLFYTGTRLEGPPAGSSPTPPSPPATGAGVDETPFKATDIIWECPAGNVGAWSITSKITSASLSKETLAIVRNPMDNWPSDGAAKPAIGNWWIIGLCSDGKWHGGTVDWLGPGRTSCDAPKFDGTDSMSTGGSPQLIDAWRPSSGDVAYVMQSTHARAGIAIPGNTQRTNIVKVIIP